MKKEVDFNGDKQIHIIKVSKKIYLIFFTWWINIKIT